MVNFANNEFNDRLINPKFHSQRAELQEIFKHIFGKN